MWVEGGWRVDDVCILVHVFLQGGDQGEEKGEGTRGKGQGNGEGEDRREK